MKKKILLIGGNGGLGIQLVDELKNEFDCIVTSSGRTLIAPGTTVCDVTKSKSVKRLIDETEFDIIIYLSVKNIDGLIHNQSEFDVESQLNVNVKGFLNVLRYATPKLRAKQYGRIIYISSILSTNPIRGTGIYSATKAFSDNLIRTYSLENSKYGITANSIQLGYFEGGLTENVPTEILDNVIKTVPLRRLGNSHEFGNVVKAIIETEYINGTHIQLNGGL
jgi:NAD(P)-dependent dehydrogenase (short-subunit alcohol dehydrogenase family)